MTFLDAIILGIVQGLTEFLPVSSSGHLELGATFLNLKNTDNLLFSIMVHGATALSTMVVFRQDILQIIKDLFEFKWNNSTKFVAMIAVSMIPVGIVGLLFEAEIEAFFGGKTIFVASMLMLTGILLTISYFAGETNEKLDFRKAFVIGLAQAIAVLPGISRSGATISTALILGVDREEAARFSFLMVLAPILGAMTLKIKGLFDDPVAMEAAPEVGILISGFLAAFISGLLACKWMIRLVKKGKLIYFAFYCFTLATIVMFLYW